jgi:hypothetical protein
MECKPNYILDVNMPTYPQCKEDNLCPKEEKYNDCKKCNEAKQCKTCTDSNKHWHNNKCVDKDS